MTSMRCVELATQIDSARNVRQFWRSSVGQKYFEGPEEYWIKSCRFVCCLE